MCAQGLLEVMCIAHLRWSDGVFCRTSSQMCISWYFPIFLLRDGSLTQKYMASLMFLVMPCASLPIMVQQSALIGCPMARLCWWMGWGALRCPFSLPQSPSKFPDILSSHSAWVHLYPWTNPLFWTVESLSLGATNRWQMVLLPLKWICISRLLQVLLNLLLRPLE